jgi:diguanylate cyclase (GGDEF)-like protein/PAS domain S-box-containing protein
MLATPSPEVFQAIVDRIETGVYALDLDQRVVYWNFGAQKITGFLSQDVLGRPCADSILVEYDHHNPVVCTHHCPLESGIGQHAHREVVTYLRHRQGHVIPVRLWTMALTDPAGSVTGAAKVFTEKALLPELTREETARGRHQDLDPETELPSRAGTETFLREQIQLAEKQRVPCGLIVVRLATLEDFRRKHGSEASSAILREVSQTLKDMVRRTDLLGRWSADCFLGVLPGCAIEPLERVGARMKKVAGRVAISWWGDRLSVEVSVGVTMVETGDTVETIGARLGAVEEVSVTASENAGA